MHYSTLTTRTKYLQEFVHAVDQREELLQDLLEQCKLHLGSSDIRTHHLRNELTRYYYINGQHAEALRVG